MLYTRSTGSIGDGTIGRGCGRSDWSCIGSTGFNVFLVFAARFFLLQLSGLRDLRSCGCQYCTASLVVPLVLFCYSLLSDFFLACFSPCMFSTEYNTWYKFSTQESNMSPVALRDPICSSSAYQNTINSRIIVVL